MITPYTTSTSIRMMATPCSANVWNDFFATDSLTVLANIVPQAIDECLSGAVDGVIEEACQRRKFSLPLSLRLRDRLGRLNLAPLTANADLCLAFGNLTSAGRPAALCPDVKRASS